MVFIVYTSDNKVIYQGNLSSALDKGRDEDKAKNIYFCTKYLGINYGNDEIVKGPNQNLLP